MIGGPLPLICLPLVAKERETLLAQAEETMGLQPDLLEWRVDDYSEVTDIDASLSLLKELRAVIGDIPLIFTCRIDKEGGLQQISQQVRLQVIVAAMKSGYVDLVDIELCNESGFIEAVRKGCDENGVKLIISNHNFSNTPDAETIYSRLLKAREVGADIPKLAAMPRSYADVLSLMSATNRARNEGVDCPMITISMGQEGAISRLAGGLFGSDITFGVGSISSAPGQVPIADLKTGMALLYPTS